MRKSLVHPFLIVLLFFSSSTMAKTDVEQKVEKILDLIKNIHYNHASFTDKNAKETLTEFIKYLDPYSIYFYDKDVLFFKDLEGELTSCPALFSDLICDSAISIYRRRLFESKNHINDISTKELNFYQADTLALSPRYIGSYCSTKSELIKRWTKLFKLRVISSLVSDTDSRYTKLNLSDTSSYPFDVYTKKVAVKFTQEIQNILEHPEGFENFVKSLYLKALTASFDPHTTYFSENENRQFTESMSTTFRGFGVTTRDNMQGQIVVEHIEVGSSAWKSDSLHEGDVILTLTPKGAETIDLQYHNNTFLSELLHQADLEEADFLIRKAEGSVAKIHLVKDNIISPNFIGSYILKGARNIGYLRLPSFYMGCGAEFQKEIIKLKNDKVEGIILDLSDNGGGSLLEVSEIASCFIDSGKFAEAHSTVDGIFALNKHQVPHVFSKPLVVLVNSATASASELLAGILKSYGRAVIVGTNTFGKGTGQIVVPLSFQNMSPLGHLKLTVEKLYFANGISSQLKGVEPHIALPYLMDHDRYREKGFSNPLASDTLFADTCFTPPYQLEIGNLYTNNKQRTDTSKIFRLIRSEAENYAFLDSSKKTFSLHVDSFKVMNTQYNKAHKIATQLENYRCSGFVVDNHSFYHFDNKNASDEESIRERLKKSIHSNMYIEACFYILIDLIQTREKKQPIPGTKFGGK